MAPKQKISLSMPPSFNTAAAPTPASPSWRGPHTGVPLSVASAAPPPTEIVPNVFIADLGAAENPKVLVQLGITHVLSAIPFAELAEYLPASTHFLSDALRDPKARVLVHCAQGISRSSSVVCAYLIAKYGWSPERAVRFVKSKYALADPNPGFVMQLGEYARSLERPR
ncbi:protein-tyrosine phosphatase-like protein [Fomitopsis serialis]|uniref:protein-tyrosine phosphatase-like protein n=1 Tax=Fomitopsis serialis TaxID=139415 RepID=UPI0020073F08|nr:protein-tyrosine phosphatase-like protein [Neoantrodia serialis]KAH9930665.1 protein-tyrosine phosphatase-like protein [Neoantrodia serialis]